MCSSDLFVARTPEEKAMQRALLQCRNPKNRELVLRALVLAGREDLIGGGPDCLIRGPVPVHIRALAPSSNKSGGKGDRIRKPAKPRGAARPRGGTKERAAEGGKPGKARPAGGFGKKQPRRGKGS